MLPMVFILLTWIFGNFIQEFVHTKLCLYNLIYLRNKRFNRDSSNRRARECFTKICILVNFVWVYSIVFIPSPLQSHLYLVLCSTGTNQHSRAAAEEK